MPSSALGAAAAAYAARADRPRRVTRLSANLTALAAIGEPSPATSHKERPPSPKRWTRETPGGVDEDGTIHRPGSPLRLSSSYLDQAGSRQFMRKVSGARYTNALLYGLLLLPLFVVVFQTAWWHMPRQSASHEGQTASFPGALDEQQLQSLQADRDAAVRLSKSVTDLARRHDNAVLQLSNVNAELQKTIESQQAVIATLQERLTAVEKRPVATGDTADGVRQLRSDIARQSVAADARLSAIDSRLDALSTARTVAAASHSSSGSSADIDRALYRFMADKTELVDFALELTGGSVLSVSGTHRMPMFSSGLLSKFLFMYPARSEKELLRPDMTPGRCWPMAGRSGWVHIGLSAAIYPTAVTVEHVAPEIAPNFETAPKLFSVYAVSIAGVHEQTRLGSFEYVKPGPGVAPVVQTFEFSSLVSSPVTSVNFTVEDNFGGDYTCLYRVRVHGHT
ncbi:SUN domain-containing protein [Plasmodiophora brassicae]